MSTLRFLWLWFCLLCAVLAAMGLAMIGVEYLRYRHPVVLVIGLAVALHASFNLAREGGDK